MIDEDWPVEVVDECDITRYREECKRFVDLGYVLVAANCCCLNSEQYDFCSNYQAILVKGK